MTVVMNIGLYRQRVCKLSENHVGGLCGLSVTQTNPEVLSIFGQGLRLIARNCQSFIMKKLNKNLATSAELLITMPEWAKISKCVFIRLNSVKLFGILGGMELNIMACNLSVSVKELQLYKVLLSFG